IIQGSFFGLSVVSFRTFSIFIFWDVARPGSLSSITEVKRLLPSTTTYLFDSYSSGITNKDSPMKNPDCPIASINSIIDASFSIQLTISDSPIFLFLKDDGSLGFLSSNLIFFRSMKSIFCPDRILPHKKIKKLTPKTLYHAFS
ncbi:hypothetical protein Q4R95_18305, partial [Morganella morganii]